MFLHRNYFCPGSVSVCKHISLSYNPKGACNAAIIAGKVVAFSTMKCYLL